MEGWRLCHSAKTTSKAEGEGVEPSRLIARLFSRQVPSPDLACPSVEAAAAGIEPAKGRLTGACLYQHRPHRNRSQGGRTRTCDLKLPELARCQASLHSGKVGAGRFEPPISCSRSTRVSRLPHTPKPNSAQRELNPHFRHGKAAGYRYIMGASNRWPNCQRSEHRVGLEPTSPHYGCGILAAGRPVLVIQWDQRGSNPHRVRLRARHAATSTLIPLVLLAASVGLGAEGIEPSTWSL